MHIPSETPAPQILQPCPECGVRVQKDVFITSSAMVESQTLQARQQAARECVEIANKFVRNDDPESDFLAGQDYAATEIRDAILRKFEVES